MARVFSNINGIVFTGTREECNEYIADAEQEAGIYASIYPELDELDLEYYTVEEE